MTSFDKLLIDINNCKVCEKHLPLGPRPVVSVSKKSKILIIGQAPGTKVHASGIPWDDQSGKNLRAWLNVTNEQFYNPDLFGIVPMGFCYPGKGKSGDLPPRKECAPLWHEALLNELPELELVLLIGVYAQKYYLKSEAKKNLTETVLHFSEYLPKNFVLPHPSPRNAIWMKKNPWFAHDVLPTLRERVHALI
ncbi:MAG: uracil-DNA glycosylase family protein [Crocinitomicaceae bacterium]|nr:uracil-DNA glycosylase family protein [Crocinitomicaceae bacterium]